MIAVFLVCFAGQQLAGQQFTTIDYPGAASTTALAISKDGIVMGRWTDASGNSHGYLWINGAIYGFDCQGAVATGPRAMNSRYEAVGTYKNADGKWLGFYLELANPASWEPAGAKCVPIDPKGSVGRTSGTGAFGISETGEIAGWFDDAQNVGHGYVYRGGVFLTYDMIEAAGANPMGMSALGMTPQGEIFGHMQVTGDRMRGWILSQNKMAVLDFPPGDLNGMTCGFAVNSKGEATGHYQRKGEMIRGMHYKNGAYTSFEVPNSTTTDGRGINEDGVIVGYYNDQGGKTHGFILRR